MRQLSEFAKTFRGKLALRIGGLALLGLVGLGSYLGHVASQELARQAGQTLQLQARATADLLATHLRERELEIELLSRSNLLTHGPLTSPQVREVLQRHKVLHDEYAWIGVTDPTGRVLQATDDLLLHQDVGQRPWFQPATRGPYTGDVHDAVLLAKLMSAPPGGLYLIDFAAPIRDSEGRLRGVLGSHAHWNWITGVVSGAVLDLLERRQGEVLIANREGEILYPLVQLGKLTLPAGLDVTRPYQTLEWAGQPYLTASAPVAGNRHELGWRIVLREPLAGVQAPLRLQWLELLLLVCVLASVLALLAYRIAAQTSRPIEALAAVVRRVSQGERQPDFPQVRHSIESAQLTHDVQRMTEILLHREDELAQLNQSLEQQVAHRTEELSLANEELTRLARRDPLTGVFNRRRFDEKLQELFALLKRNGRVFAVVMMDVDHFKRVNDTYGHAAGDQVLRQLANLLTASVRVTDTVARVGGEEFVLLLPETFRLDEAHRVAQKIRCAFAQLSFGEVPPQTLSLGVTLADASDDHAREVLERADAALYQSKSGGRNRVTCLARPA